MSSSLEKIRWKIKKLVVIKPHHNMVSKVQNIQLHFYIIIEMTWMSLYISYGPAIKCKFLMVLFMTCHHLVVIICSGLDINGENFRLCCYLGLQDKSHNLRTIIVSWLHFWSWSREECVRKLLWYYLLPQEEKDVGSGRDMVVGPFLRFKLE